MHYCHRNLAGVQIRSAAMRAGVRRADGALPHRARKRRASWRATSSSIAQRARHARTRARRSRRARRARGRGAGAAARLADARSLRDRDATSVRTVPRLGVPAHGSALRRLSAAERRAACRRRRSKPIPAARRTRRAATRTSPGCARSIPAIRRDASPGKPMRASRACRSRSMRAPP